MSIYCRSRTKNDIILFWLLRIESWKRILIGRKLKSSSLAKTNMVITSCIIMCILMQRYIIWNDRLFLSSEHQENMLKLYSTVLQSLEIKAYSMDTKLTLLRMLEKRISSSRSRMKKHVFVKGIQSEGKRRFTMPLPTNAGLKDFVLYKLFRYELNYFAMKFQEIVYNNWAFKRI